VAKQHGRQEHYGAYTAVRGERVGGDAETVALRERPDDSEAEARRVAQPGDVHRAPARQQFGGVVDRLAVHADTRVVDHHAGAVVHCLDRDFDGRVGLRVACCVVEQFGDREHHRFHRPTLHGDVDVAVDADTPVVADAGGGAADDFDERRSGALAARPGAAEHGDGLGATAELCVRVVDFEQVTQHVGVVVPVLHFRDGHLLFVGQGLDGAHRRLQSGLRGLVGARLRVLDGRGEPVQDVVETDREVRAGEAGVERIGPRGRPVGRVLHRREPDREEVAKFRVPRPQAMSQFRVPRALASGDAALTHEQHGDGEQAKSQAPGHGLRYLIGHGVLTSGRELTGARR
jgi:hypothetical protein